MAFESDLIRRYSGAFTKDDCQKILEGIKFFEDNHLLFYDKSYLTSEDHKVINVTHDYDFSASLFIISITFLEHSDTLKNLSGPAW